MKQWVQNMVKTYKQMNKPDDKFNIKKFSSLQYPQCPFGGDHSGEAMSLICLEKDCLQSQILCCCICQEEFHKGHQLKPLKLLLCEYDQQLREYQNISLKQSEKDILIKKINEQEEKQLIYIQEFKEQINNKLSKIVTLEKEFFENLRKFVKMRDFSTGNQYAVIETIIQNQTNVEMLSSSVKNLLDALVVQEIPEKDLNYEEINRIFDFHMKDQKDHLSQLEKQFNQGIQQQIDLLQSKTQATIFQKSYLFQFLPNNKHPQVDIIQPKIVKASNSNHGYKFAVMTPSLDKNQTTVFGFKLNFVHQSNWIAVGVCDLSIVQSKQFGFAFQSLGHGAYMVSSNGGVWSSTTSNLNNVVKCFKFGKGDVIVCTFDPKNETITFHKQKSSTTFKLDIPKSDHEFYPCVLFYYALDEVEFIPPEGINKQ
ncbi:unnamed protein product (macronuclear) [Paramecium tetraurelia]|uniref:SPRY domain-containing protein n=1 Tax=Paramecium tetraurelia TaxID=5888 RepID=A0BV87_PARTE|nr:uncharacterized protein GSPATT00005700001 [Paramecium tetraurelia]CAK62454.1 unnamed protein product [Paramecium tetraurelia]|eukprot:XP_001429852.1 hypothetical protein (macronuclear) [Paramecium tetraurelia strain d4-2]